MFQELVIPAWVDSTSAVGVGDLDRSLHWLLQSAWFAERSPGRASTARYSLELGSACRVRLEGRRQLPRVPPLKKFNCCSALSIGSKKPGTLQPSGPGF